jgi:anti-anti-sigma factor
LLLLRVEGRVFFANVGQIGQKMNSLADEAKPRVVAIDLSAVTDLEYTALKMLTAAVERLRQQGVSLWLVGLNPGVLQVVQRSALSHLLGLDALYFNLELAVAKYQTSSVSLLGGNR